VIVKNKPQKMLLKIEDLFKKMYLYKRVAQGSVSDV
jgi:hypothetical protein